MQRTSLILVAGLLVSSPASWAQHDVQRNAVRQIVRGEYEAAAKTLASKKKPNSGAAETHYVEMLSLLAQDKIEEAQAKARAALDAGLPPGRFVSGPRSLLAKLPPVAEAAALSLVHGPMVGDLASDGALIWVRTRKAAEVAIVAGGRKASGRTSRESDFTAVVRLAGLKPGTTYKYEVHVDGQKQIVANAEFTTAPAAGKPAAAA